MKLKQIMFMIMFFVFCVSSVSAINMNFLKDNSESYFMFNESSGTNAVNLVPGGGINATLSGAVGFNSAGKIERGLLFDTGNTNVRNVPFHRLTNLNKWSVNVWVKPTNLPTGTIGDAHIIFQQWESNNKMYWGLRTTNYALSVIDGSCNPSAGRTNHVGSLSSSNNVWYMMGLTYDGSHLRVYRNGILIDIFAQSSICDNSDLFGLGSSSSDNYRFRGYMDELSVYNDVLNTTHFSFLYANSSPNYEQQYPFETSSLTFENITANSETLINNSFFNTSTIEFETFVLNESTNGNVNQTYYLYHNNTLINSSQFATNNVNGTLTLENLLKETYKISFYAENNETNVTSQNYTFTIDTTPPTINNTLPIETNSYTINISDNIECTSPNLATCTIYFEKDNVTINTTDNNYTFTYNGYQNYTITATTVAGNIATETGTILVNPYQYFLFEDLGGNQIQNFTLDGTFFEEYAKFKLFDYGYGNFSFLFEKFGFGSTNISVFFNETTNYNETNVIQFAKINLNIYDRTNFNFMTQKVDIALITASKQFDYQTSNGSITLISDDLAGSNTIRVGSSNYKTEYFDFDFSNKEILNLNFYLLEENKSSLVVVFVKRGTSNLENAVVTAQQFINNSKEVVTTTTTNSDGVALLNLQEDTVWYDICVSYDLFYRCIKNKIIDEYDIANGILITFSIEDLIQLRTDDMYLYNIWGNVRIIAETNTTVTFEATYNDPDMYFDEYCLFVYEGNISSQRNLVSEKCIISKPTGSIGYTGSNEKELLAVLRAKKGNKIVFVDSVSTKVKFNLEGILGGFAFGIMLLCVFGVLLFPGEKVNIKEITIMLMMIFVVISQRALGLWGEGITLGMVLLGVAALVLMRRAE